MFLNLTHIHALDLPLRLTVWHFYNITAAHGTDLKLSEPLSEAGLMKNMTTVWDLLKFLLIIEFFQANGAVIVFGNLSLVVDIIQHPHVSLY